MSPSMKFRAGHLWDQKLTALHYLRELIRTRAFVFGTWRKKVASVWRIFKKKFASI